MSSGSCCDTLILKKTLLVLLKQSLEQSSPHPAILESPILRISGHRWRGNTIASSSLKDHKDIQLRCVHHCYPQFVCNSSILTDMLAQGRFFIWGSLKKIPVEEMALTLQFFSKSRDTLDRSQDLRR